MSKKGLLIVSFGTSYPEALERDILPVEQALAAAFPDRIVKRAFGSGMIIRKLRKRDGLIIPTVEEALKEFEQKQFCDLLIQPTFLIHGIEYDRLMEAVNAHRNHFEAIRVGRPLLSSTADYIALASEISRLHPAEKGTLVLMGHGTEHYANAAYPALETVFRRLGAGHIAIGAVEGYPDIDLVCSQLVQEGIKQVTLRPLMLVAGDHAINDMASDEPDSWKSILTRSGISSDCILSGLGGLDFVKNMFIEHAREA